MGYIISEDGIRLDPGKVREVREWEPPETAYDIRSFLGLCQAYSSHIKNFAHIAAPLSDLLKGVKTRRQRMVLTEAATRVFEALKVAVTEAPCLVLASWDEPFEVWTDASNIAIGAVLQQHSHPVAFLSRKLNSAEKNYSVYDKELLSVINALKHWKHFVYGREFVVRTDHQALRWLQSMPSANWSDRQARWSQYFEQFGGMIEYIPGKANPVLQMH